jgi:hypothetical protein
MEGRYETGDRLGCQAAHTKVERVDKGAGAGFLRVLRFPLPIFIPPISPQSPSLIIRGWYNRPVVAAVHKVGKNKELGS